MATCFVLCSSRAPGGLLATVAAAKAKKEAQRRVFKVVKILHNPSFYYSMSSQLLAGWGH